MSDTATMGLAPDWYEPANQKEADNPAKYLVEGLTPAQISTLQKYFNRQTGEVDGEGLYKAAVMGLRGWEGVDEPGTGNALKFAKQNIQFIPYVRMIEIGGRVLADSKLGAEEAKN